jgi:predicted TPR repeat methyltransferase
MRPENLPDEEFDIIISTSVLEHIYDLDGYFQLVQSHLSENGVFIFNGLTPAIIKKERRTGKFRDASPIHHVNMFTSSSLKRVAGKYGLYPVKIKQMFQAVMKKKALGLHFLNYFYHSYIYFGGRSGVFLYILTK